MVTDVKLLHPEKTPLSILVIEFEIVTDVKLLQSEKHHSPKVVTELGIWLFLHPATNSLVEV